MKKSDLNKGIVLSEGNRKLASTDTSQYLIFNLPAITTCPNRTAECERLCYARKSERIYPQVLPCRKRNLAETKKDGFTIDMIHHIQWHIGRSKNKGKQIFFRWHEAGDVYSLEYFKSMAFIASALLEVKFLLYTKSVSIIKEYKKQYNIPNNLIIRFSVWNDTEPEQLEIAKEMDLPIFTAFDKNIIDYEISNNGYTKCDCICKDCKMCYDPEIKKIAVTIH